MSLKDFAVSIVLLLCLVISGCHQSRSATVLYPSPAWYADYKSAPSPSRASPDGRRLLIDDKSDPRALVLRVFNVDTRQVEHTLVRKDQCMRYLWNPDGKRISFFCFGGMSRKLYVWNMDTGKVDRVDVPRTQGEGWLAWSPDGRYLAYMSSAELPGQAGQYILVDSKDWSVFQLPLSTTVTTLSWLRIPSALLCLTLLILTHWT